MDTGLVVSTITPKLPEGLYKLTQWLESPLQQEAVPQELLRNQELTGKFGACSTLQPSSRPMEYFEEFAFFIHAINLIEMIRFCQYLDMWPGTHPCT